MPSAGSPPSVCPSLLKCSHLGVHQDIAAYNSWKFSSLISSSLCKWVLEEQQPQEQNVPFISVQKSQGQTENVLISDLFKKKKKSSF